MTARSDARVYLDMTHVPAVILRNKFRHVYTTCLNYGLDITHDRIPITPAAHYFMGGVRTDLNGRSSLRGLYAAGEVASTGVHGANRLASNSLLEALVFSGRAAATMKEEQEVSPLRGANQSSVLSTTANPEIRDITWRYAGIVRNAQGLKNGLQLLDRIQENSNLLTVARLIHECAVAREESRGAHYREDFPNPAEAKLHTYVQKARGLKLE